MSELVRLRWIVPADGTRIGLAERLEHPLRAVAERLNGDGAVESLYLSKQLRDDVGSIWLTLFTEAQFANALVEEVEESLGALNRRRELASDPSAEELLEDRCTQFRRCLQTMTRIALDLHRPECRSECGVALIEAGRAGRRGRAQLEPLLRLHSPTFRALNDPEEFWLSLPSSCLAEQQTDCVHWLYNLVLAYDGPWERPAREIAAGLGMLTSA